MKKVMFFFGTLLMVALNWQCERVGNVPSQQPDFGETIQLSYGETVTFLPDNLEIRFDSVTQDSRCPATVSCIWAGMAEVKLVFRKDQMEEIGYLNTMNDPESITVFGRTVRLLDVSPYPQTPEDVIAQEDYKIKIVVE